MANVDWQDRAGDFNRRTIPDIYKPKALRLNPVEDDVAALDFAGDHPDPVDEPAVDLGRLEVELGRKRLDEIADVMRALTYGEMMELAASMWNVKPDGSSLTEDNLPAVLYRWSTSRHA